MEDEREPLIRKYTTKAFNRCISHADDELCSFRSCLRWMCVDQSSILRACFSWSLFLLLSIIVPLLSHFVLACSTCDARHHRPYDTVVQLSLTVVATLSFFCLSRFVHRYGLRRFLFLDKLRQESEQVALGYTEQLNSSWKLLLVFVLPCFAVESAYKIWWYSSGASRIPFLGNAILSDMVACTLELCSWLYRTSIFFLMCVLFRLLCSLQILRLQDFAIVFQVESEVASVLKEHLRIRRHLRIISHRYRGFILFALLFITASLLASLLVTTRSNAVVNIFTTGELALCSVTLMTGLLICLRSATRITHKAQSVTSLAAKWHVCATIDSFDCTDGETPMASQTDARPHVRDFPINANGEWEDDDTADGDDELDNTNLIMPIYARTISFHKRQALVTYFENNRTGITVYGFTLDRSFLHLIFGVEMSLVLWLLGKTIVTLADQVRDLFRQMTREPAVQSINYDPTQVDLSIDIMNEPWPRDQRMEKITQYARTTDPVAHLTVFRTKAAMIGIFDRLMCCMFVATFTGMAATWFATLPPRSIFSFEQLRHAFVNKFAQKFKWVGPI